MIFLWDYVFDKPMVGTARCAVRTPQRGIPTIENDYIAQKEHELVTTIRLINQ